MTSSREGGFDVSLSWCDRRALFFFSFSCINNINSLAVYPDRLRLEAVIAIRCSASAPPARRPEPTSEEVLLGIESVPVEEKLTFVHKYVAKLWATLSARDL